MALLHSPSRLFRIEDLCPSALQDTLTGAREPDLMGPQRRGCSCEVVDLRDFYDPKTAAISFYLMCCWEENTFILFYFFWFFFLGGGGGRGTSMAATVLCEYVKVWYIPGPQRGYYILTVGLVSYKAERVQVLLYPILWP